MDMRGKTTLFERQNLLVTFLRSLQFSCFHRQLFIAIFRFCAVLLLMQTKQKKLRNISVDKLPWMTESGQAKWWTYPFCRVLSHQCSRWRDRYHKAGRLLALQTAVWLPCVGWRFFLLEWFHFTWDLQIKKRKKHCGGDFKTLTQLCLKMNS